MHHLLSAHIPLSWVAALAVVALVLGVLLILSGSGMRRRHGLGLGRTLDLDRRNLYSRRYRLAGRPDRLEREGSHVIPEEWKEAHTLRPWHRAQIGVYFILLEEESGVRPPYGTILCGDDTRYRVENTDELRAWVLSIADQIRRTRADVTKPIPVTPKRGQCPPCGMRVHCTQARL